MGFGRVGGWGGWSLGRVCRAIMFFFPFFLRFSFFLQKIVRCPVLFFFVFFQFLHYCWTLKISSFGPQDQTFCQFFFHLHFWVSNKGLFSCIIKICPGGAEILSCPAKVHIRGELLQDFACNLGAFCIFFAFICVFLHLVFWGSMLCLRRVGWAREKTPFPPWSTSESMHRAQNAILLWFTAFIIDGVQVLSGRLLLWGTQWWKTQLFFFWHCMFFISIPTSGNFSESSETSLGGLVFPRPFSEANLFNDSHFTESVCKQVALTVCISGSID